MLGDAIHFSGDASWDPLRTIKPSESNTMRHESKHSMHFANTYSVGKFMRMPDFL